MKALLSLALLMSACCTALAQSKDRSGIKEFLWPYDLPATNNNGPMDINVWRILLFREKVAGDEYKVWVNFKVTRIEFMAKYGTRRYKYKGTVYREDEVRATDGLTDEGFGDLRLTGVSIRITAGNIKDAKEVYIGTSGISSDVGRVTKDKDIDHLSSILPLPCSSGLTGKTRFPGKPAVGHVEAGGGEGIL